MRKDTKELLGRVSKARNFPHNTCPASRHTEMIGEALARSQPFAMLSEEPEHCGGSLLATIAALYEARTQLALADALIATHRNSIDAGPRERWPAGSILEAAIARHEKRTTSDLGRNTK